MNIQFSLLNLHFRTGRGGESGINEWGRGGKKKREKGSQWPALYSLFACEGKKEAAVKARGKKGEKKKHSARQFSFLGLQKTLQGMKKKGGGEDGCPSLHY